VTIDGRRVGPGEPCFVIAEAGVNHNGDLDLARRLVDAAADAGADAVKFQTFRAAGVVSTTAPKAAYQLASTARDESQLDMLQRLELADDSFLELKERAERRGITFLSTPFDHASVDLLERMDVAAFKVASPDVTNHPLLADIGSRSRPVLLSTGTADLAEVQDAVAVLRAAGVDDIVVLHCVSEYPALAADANLRAMATLANALDVPVGYSDHTQGLEVAVAAVALGAAVLEKNFALDRSLPGPDQRASLEPDELAELVRSVRSVESALGDGVKRPSEKERANVAVLRRSLAAARDLEAGTVLEESMLVALRPGTGLSPTRVADVVGRPLVRKVTAGRLLADDDLG